MVLPTALLSALALFVLPFAGGDVGTIGCGAGAAAPILATIRAIESGGDYGAESAGSTASGAYQFLDSTWAGFGGYSHAADAPPAVQDAKATANVQRILAANAGDVATVPVTWYIGHVPTAGSLEWDVVPFPGAGNRLTPREYVSRWMVRYEQEVAGAAAVVEGPESITSSSPTSPACGATVNGEYALPIPREIIEGDPAMLSRPHHDYPAIDLPVPVGTPVYAVHGGTVTRISNESKTCYPDPSTCTDICGLGVVVADAEAVEWTYCHASRVLVSVGAHIATGARLMASGNTGHSSGPHLHLGIRVVGESRCPHQLLHAVLGGHGWASPQRLTTDCVSTK